MPGRPTTLAIGSAGAGCCYATWEKVCIFLNLTEAAETAAGEVFKHRKQSFRSTASAG